MNVFSFTVGARTVSQSVFLVALALALACVHHAFRAERPLFVPPSNPAAAALPVVTALQVREALNSSQAVVVDSRPREAFLAETIPGSLSLPLHADWDEKTLQRLRQASSVIVFCSDERCQVSRETALALMSRRVVQVSVYPAGISGWKQLGFELSPGSTPQAE